MTTIDIRSKKTRQQIIEAFITLLHQKSLEKIKIADITNQAQINRATFYNTKKKFSTYPKLIHDWSRFDFEKLADLPEEYEAILRQYQVYTQMPDSRIEKQVAGLKWRIANLKSYS